MSSPVSRVDDVPRRGAAHLPRPFDLWIWIPLPLLAAVAVACESVAPEVGLHGLMALNFMHLAATWTRLYGPERHQWRALSFLLPGALVALCGGLVAMGHHDWLVMVVFLANIPHIGLQNFGLIRLVERAEGRRVVAIDRRLDQLYQALVPTWLAFWFATRPGADLFDSRALGLDRMPEAVMWLGSAVTGLLGLGLLVRMVAQWWTGQPPSRVRWMVHLCWGPAAWMCFVWLPPELAAIPLAGAHYIQYLVIVRCYHQRQRRGRPNAWGRLHPLLWSVALLVLAPGIPFVVDQGLSSVLPHTGLVLGSAASLHHFVVDSQIWKLRLPQVARTLLA